MPNSLAGHGAGGDADFNPIEKAACGPCRAAGATPWHHRVRLWPLLVRALLRARTVDRVHEGRLIRTHVQPTLASSFFSHFGNQTHSGRCLDDPGIRRICLFAMR